MWAATRHTALVVLLAHGPSKTTRAEDEALERQLQSIPSFSIAILSSRQGGYTPQRMEQDVAAAARVAARVGDSTRVGGSIRSSSGRLVVLDLPGGVSGFTLLRRVAAARPRGELMLVLQRARAPGAHELLWAAAAGIGEGQHTLSSQTTEQRGLIAAVDVAPTLLEHLRLPIPIAMRGKPIRLDGGLDGRGLRSLKARLEVVYPRRLPALVCLLGACALLLLAASALRRRGLVARLLHGDRVERLRNRRQARQGGVRWAMRVCALALLFSPVAMLVPAAVEPSAAGEYALIVSISLALGALTDVLVPWPRALVAPALAAVLAFGVDALSGSQLLIRSLLGPNPAYGSRFYGIGNELKSALAVLVFAAVAAGLYRATRSRRSAATMGGAGALLAIVEGWARIGAGVGGVILVCAGTAVATIMLLPGRIDRARTLTIALGAPLLGLALLAALDLTTAHGAGHYTGSVLHAHSFGEVLMLVGRRYEAAWEELGNGLMPIATTLASVLAIAGVRYRNRVLGPVFADPAWLAALAGGLTAGVVGALSEDSGPVLLVAGVSALACVVAYLWGSPPSRPGNGHARTRHRLPSWACASVARWRPLRRRADSAPGCRRTASPGSRRSGCAH